MRFFFLSVYMKNSLINLVHDDLALWNALFTFNLIKLDNILIQSQGAANKTVRSLIEHI